MFTKIIIGSIVVGIIGLGVFFMYASSTRQSAEEQQHAQNLHGDYEQRTVAKTTTNKNNERESNAEEKIAGGIPQKEVREVTHTPKNVTDGLPAFTNIVVQEAFAEETQNTGDLLCDEDGEVLQWDGGTHMWRCRLPVRAVFDDVDEDYVDIASDGAIGCKGDNEFLYWNTHDARWSCGSIGKGITVDLQSLGNVSAESASENQVLQFDGSVWKPQTLATSTGLDLSYLTAGSLLFYDGSKIAQNQSNLVWDNTHNRLGIGTTSPASALDVTGTLTATTAQTSIRDTGGQVCNVQAYGAVGDDATDNYDAITAAIAACPEAGIVLFPPGVYRISQSIVLDRPVTLRGTHAPRWSYSSLPRTSIKPTASFTGQAIVHVRDKSLSGEVEHNNGGKIENISIDGNSYGTDIVGIYFEGLVRDWDVEHVDISQTSGDGFRSDQGAGSGYPRGFTVEHLSIYSPEKHGLRAVALNDSYLEDVLVVGGAQRGFYLTSIGETKFVGSRAVFNALEGLYIDGSTLNGGVQFTDFSTDRNDRHGVFIAATGTTTISFNGLLTRRDGKNDWGGTNPPYAGVAVIGTAGNKVAPVIISNLAQTPGINDDSTGEPSPSTGVRVEYAEYVSIEGVLWGVDTSYTDGGNNDHFIIQDKSLLKEGYSTVTSSVHANSTASLWNDVGNNNIAYTAGNVGIGTTSPQKQVHIAGEATPAMRMTDTTNTVSIDMRADDYQGFLGTSTNHDLRLMTNGSSRMTILTNGNVGIGTTAPSEALHVAGNILATGTITPSDARLKENITPITSALDKLLTLHGVSYDYRDTGGIGNDLPKGRQYGVLAQDVEKSFPELVKTYAQPHETAYKAVNYPGLIAPLIESIRELYAKMIAFEKNMGHEDGGRIVIAPGDKQTTVHYKKVFDARPLLLVSPDHGGVVYRINNETHEGFDIALDQPSAETITFTWIASAERE